MNTIILLFNSTHIVLIILHSTRSEASKELELQFNSNHSGLILLCACELELQFNATHSVLIGLLLYACALELQFYSTQFFQKKFICMRIRVTLLLYLQCFDFYMCT